MQTKEKKNYKSQINTTVSKEYRTKVAQSLQQNPQEK